MCGIVASPSFTFAALEDLLLMRRKVEVDFVYVNMVILVETLQYIIFNCVKQEVGCNKNNFRL
jgi:hypothetical protein